MSSFTSQPAGVPTSVHATAYPCGVTVELQQFTALDRHVGTNACVLPWAFLYKDTLQPDLLQAALAATLNTFPTLAGRVQPLQDPAMCCMKPRAQNWQLRLCNDGVPLSVYTSPVTLQQLLDSGLMSCRRGFTFPDAQATTLPAYMEHLEPMAVLSGDAPVLTVRLTQLAGGGSILAVTAAHVVLDGRSYVTFMQHWARQYRSISVTEASEASAPAIATTGVPARRLLDSAHQPSAAVATVHAACATSRANDNKQPLIKLATASDTPPQPGAPTSTCTSSASNASEEEPEPNTWLETGSANGPGSASAFGPCSVKAAKPFTYTPDPLYPTRVLPAGWLAAFKSVRAMFKQTRAEAKHIKLAHLQKLGTAINTSNLSTELLYIPGHTLQKLKAAGSLYCLDGQYISTNDAVSSLVWLLMCYLRGRPLPGQARPAKWQDACLGLALDLRTTAAEAVATPPSALEDAGRNNSNICNTTPAPCLAPSKQHHDQAPGSAGLPMDYFGSAAWSIHARSCGDSGVAAEAPAQELPIAAWQPGMKPDEWRLMCSDEKVLVQALAAGAVRIRGALQAVRRTPDFNAKLLAQVQGSLQAPSSSQIAMVTSLVHRLDAFVTSWQFGIFDVMFGGQAQQQNLAPEVQGSNLGRPIMFQGLVHPVPPYHAAIMLAPAGFVTNGADISSCKQGDAGGLWCWLSVPSCLVSSMRESPVLQLLAPDARWLSLH